MDTNDNLFPVPAIEAVEAELASIEKKLAELTPLQERQAQLKTWLQLTRQVFPQSNPQAPSPASQVVASGAAGVLPLSARPLKDQVVEAAAQIYRARGPMQSRAMLEAIEALGVVVRGSDKVGTVATLLSKSPRFNNDRAAGGWVLVE